MNSDFERDGYIQVKEFIPKDAAHILCAHTFKAIAEGDAAVGASRGGGEHPSTWNTNNASAFDSLLTLLTPRMNELLDLDLVPTYYYQRSYLKGSAMSHHTDRPSCERSCTLNIGQSHPWPIYIINRETGNPTEHIAEPGDCLLYMGCTQDHWRDTFEGDWYMQIFSHWVRKDGVQGEPYKGVENKYYYWRLKPTPVEIKNYYASKWEDILYKRADPDLNKEKVMEEYDMRENDYIAGSNFTKNKYNEIKMENKK